MGKKSIYNDTFIKFAEEQYRKEYSLDLELKCMPKDYKSDLSERISSRIQIFLPSNIFIENGKLIHISCKYERTEEEEDEILKEMKTIEDELCDKLSKYETIKNECDKEERAKEKEKLEKRKLGIKAELKSTINTYDSRYDELYGLSREINIFSQCGEDEIAFFNILLENIPYHKHGNIKILKELSEDVRFDILMRMHKLYMEKEEVWGILESEWEEIEAKIKNPHIYEMDMYMDRMKGYKPEDIMIHTKEFKKLMSALEKIDKKIRESFENKLGDDSAEKIVASLVAEAERESALI